MLRPLINTKSKYQIFLVNSKNVLAYKFIMFYRKKKKCFKGHLGKLIRIVRELNWVNFTADTKTKFSCHKNTCIQSPKLLQSYNQSTMRMQR